MSARIKGIAKRVPFARSTYYWARERTTDISARWEYWRDYVRFRALSRRDARFSMRWRDCRPYLKDKTLTTPFDHHYIYHTAWAARIVALTQPPFHVDVSSALYFSALLSAFVPVRFYDYRPASLTLSNLSSGQANLLQLPFADDSVISLSCMHVVEHIGLGRYGDPLDPEGDLKAMAELQRVLAPGGGLLFVVPVGKPRIIYNAHRIYTCDQVMSAFSTLSLQQFTLVDDHGVFMENAHPTTADLQSYGCGCFWFQRSR